MRIKKNTQRKSTIDSTPIGRIIKAGNKKDFSNLKKEVDELPSDGAQRRINTISETSSYYKYRYLIVGKLVRIKRDSDIGFNTFLCEFVFDDDRKALNNAAGWTEKKEYLFDGIKFK